MSLRDDLNAIPVDSKLGAVADLLRRNDIDPADIGRVDSVSIYEGYIKNPAGEIEKTDLRAIRLVPTKADAPEWPVVQPGPAYKPPAPRAKKTDTQAWQTAVVLPDMQIGYFRGLDGELEPTHDEDAIDVALAIVRAAKPSLVVCVGDNLDLPEMSKYRHTPAYQRTTQASVDRGALLCAQLRACAPDAEIVWLAGNHEERVPNYLLDNAAAAYGLRRGNVPDNWPVLSVPFLCRMDEQRIEYRPGYPASHVWITPRLKVIHGDIVRSQGSTATAYLGREKTSVIYGHVHRREYAARTRDDHDGPREVMAASPGCLARTDGPVPSTKGGTDLDGRPIRRQEDWQLGVGVVDFGPGGHFAYENVALHREDGRVWGRWRGKEYTA